MAFGNSIRTRIETLRQRGANLPEIITRNQKAAILKAVEVATNLTPPNDRSGPHGPGTITGETKAAWATDSQTEPKVTRSNDKAISTVTLANNKNWVSFLNDGHRMDMHFVPGLVINPYSGLLEKVDPSLGGITVGTQTKYVRGLYMKETALANYRGTLERGLIADTKELMK